MLKNMLLILLTVCLNTAGQFLMKAGINRIGKIDISRFIEFLPKVVASPFIIGGFVSYAMSAVLWIVILSRAELSWAFPMVSLSYVITALLSPVLLGETFSILRFVGVLVICAGVFIVGRTFSGP
ncbi:MAG: EamA family transporter [Candidatus Krumholzibacteria bacterium]|nr:EamA family transporter [Candidatus Krumholzibacteria bacterium]